MKKKVACTILVSMFLLSTMLVTGMQEVKAEGMAVVYVDPPISYAALGHTFSINVSIANVTNLGGYEFQLYWNNTLLDCINAVETQPAAWTSPLWVGPGIQQAYNATHGRYWRGCTNLPSITVSGNFTLVTLTFQVTELGGGVLDLYGTKLADSDGSPINHDVEDGYFEYTQHQHDIAVFLDALARHLMPGDWALLNATVFNGGLNNETDVKLQLLIDGSVVNSTVIDFLQVGSSYMLSYLWTTPTVEATYNVTAYALPVPNEDDITNNVKSARVPVSYVIKVPFHYLTIQEAIDVANVGDTILVSAGIYYEQLTIYKSLTLVGEKGSISIIDGGKKEFVIEVKADNVDIRKFTVQNGTHGIFADSCNYTVISDSTITNNDIGISISSHNIISGNMIINNDAGILVRGEYNTVNDNMVANNGIGINFDLMGIDNTIYHNNFINNTKQIWGCPCKGPQYFNTWDNGCEGNYWSNYNGTDLDGDGIGDEYLSWDGLDYYPLMNPYIEGDVNHDATVDIFDVVIIAVVFGARPSDSNWNPHADLNEDEIIDIFDVIVWAAHFGETW